MNSPDLWIVVPFVDYDRDLPNAVLTTTPDWDALLHAARPGDMVSVQRWSWSAESSGYVMVELDERLAPMPLSMYPSPSSIGGDLPSESVDAYVRDADGAIRRVR